MSKTSSFSKNMKRQIVEWFEKHPGRYPSDFANEKRILPSVVRDLCNELVKEGVLEQDIISRDKGLEIADDHDTKE